MTNKERELTKQEKFEKGKKERKRKEYKEKRKRKPRETFYGFDEEQPVQEREPADVCHIKGEIRAKYGLTIDQGSTVKARWAYAAEHVSTAHALECKYECWRGDDAMWTLKGTFLDDPVLYGMNCHRSDEMELRWTSDCFISGEGYCEFYGPYIVDGIMHVTEDRRRATFTVRKRDPSKLVIDVRHPMIYDSDDEDEDAEEAAKDCDDDCCCKNHNNKGDDNDDDDQDYQDKGGEDDD